jgi:hypothetical protein
MDNDSLILLTYKNKALLMYTYKNSIDSEEHEWTLLKASKKGKENLKDALRKKVENEAGIKLGTINYLSDNYYHAKLTDNNVNNIKRHEFQLLNFFTLSEIKKLTLSPPSKKFIEQYGNLI